MDTGTDKSIPEWLNPDRLIELIELLREAGYKIGISQHIAAQDLILFLIAQEQTLDEPQRLRTLLGPIFCKSLIEQEDFQYHFDSWLELVKQISRASHTTEKANLEAQVALSPEEKIRPRWWRLQWILIFIALITGTFFFLKNTNNTQNQTGIWFFLKNTNNTQNQTGIWFFLKNTNNTQNQTGTNQTGTNQTGTNQTGTNQTGTNNNPNSKLIPINWQIAFYFLLSLCFIYISWRLFWLWRANLFLQRSSTRTTPKLQTISIPDLEQNLFPRHLFINIAKAFRQRILVPSNTLDVEKSIDAFFRHGGWVELVYRNYTMIPEYLFLVERTGYRDHQSKFVAEMIERLKNDGVYLETYFYDEDPRICFSSDEHNSPRKLHEIATKYRQHYLIVVSDTEKLFSSISGELEPWVNQLLDWENRAILTPKPVENYGYEEFVLAQDFFILPATPTGLQALSQKLQQGTATNYYPIEEIQLPLPESLRTRPLRWVERNPPPPEDIDKMLDSLKEYLGKDNFHWLAACAIFPQLHWNITVYLGNTLKTKDGHSLLEVASLTKLARLPWFRFGYIPDWLRIRLISSLTHEQEHQIRNALRDLLVKAVHDSVGGLQLEVATQSYSFSSKLVNPILHILSKKAAEDSLLRDYIFLNFMTIQPVLAISVPKEFSRILQRQKRYNSSEKTPLLNYRRQFLEWVVFGGVVLVTVVVVLNIFQAYDLKTTSKLPPILSILQELITALNQTPVDLKKAATGIVSATAREKLSQGDLQRGLEAVDELLNRGDLASADTALELIPAKQTEDPSVNFVRGRLAWQFAQSRDKKYNIDDARRYWEFAVRDQPNSVLYNNALGFAYYAEGNLSRANDAWFKAVNLALKNQNTNSITIPDKNGIMPSEALTSYAGLALSLYKSVNNQPDVKQTQYMNEAIKLRQLVIENDPVSFTIDKLAHNWLWTDQAIADWRSLLQEPTKDIKTLN
ncbi:hypothetical protein [Anabaena azotica]|uniref:hypothetical protein n=1 Tax=Anabaena azotica TaxID=197653 RepID=UPI0039A6DBDE